MPYSSDNPCWPDAPDTCKSDMTITIDKSVLMAKTNTQIGAELKELPPLAGWAELGGYVDRNKKAARESIPTDSAERKAIPFTTGVIDYFPAALAEVAKVSKAGNDKHNPGQPLHHSRGKSTDHADSIGRHLAQRGGIDPDTGMRHSAELAWRALAMLQQELEDEGLAPMPRGASYEADDRYGGVRATTAWRPENDYPKLRAVNPNGPDYNDDRGD